MNTIPLNSCKSGVWIQLCWVFSKAVSHLRPYCGRLSFQAHEVLPDSTSSLWPFELRDSVSYYMLARGGHAQFLAGCWLETTLSLLSHRNLPQTWNLDSPKTDLYMTYMWWYHVPFAIFYWLEVSQRSYPHSRAEDKHGLSPRRQEYWGTILLFYNLTITDIWGKTRQLVLWR